MMFYRYSIIFLLLTISAYTHAQNLVPNPNFEEYNETFCGIMNPGDFATTSVDWISPNSGSPSLYFTNINAACYNFQPESEYSGPIGIKGSQLPLSGNVMAGIWVYTIPDFNQRQYVQVELTTPMVAGQSYVVEFNVSLADSMEFYTDRLGAYLSTNAVNSTDDGPLDFLPQIMANDFVADAQGWTLISDTIVAAENFSHITIGNFFDDASTSPEPNPLQSGAVSTYGAYYFLDDVRVESISTVGIEDQTAAQIALYPTLVDQSFNLRTPTALGATQMMIYNAMGQLVYSESVSGQTNVIDVSTLANGIYMVEVRYKGISRIHRIVKR